MTFLEKDKLFDSFAASSYLRFMPFILFLVVLLTAFLTYSPGLSGPFIFDDGINIVSNERLKIQDLSLQHLREAAFSIPNGVLRRPLSMLSFSLNYYLDAKRITPFPDAFPFKLTNLFIHLANGVAMFLLTRLLVGTYRKYRQPSLPLSYPNWLALAVTAAWLLHPLNLTSVLYVVQRMTSLSALFALIGLIAYLWGRIKLFGGRWGGVGVILCSFFVFTTLAALSKENGILLPCFMLITELILFRFEVPKPAARIALIVFFAVCVALPLLLIAAYFLQHPDWVLAGYAKRDFSLSERLMTEARVIWFYLRLIVMPSNALMGIYHDDFFISRQIFSPSITFLAILGFFALMLCAWFVRNRQPLVAFGILFFVVGHSIESTFLPLELVHEHRNYLPMYGILLGFFHLLIEPGYSVDTRLIRRVLAILLIALFAIDTLSRVHSWANPFDLWSKEIEHHPESARANIEMGDLYAFYAGITTDNSVSKNDNYFPARQYYEQAMVLSENDVNALFRLIRLNASQGKTVEQQWLRELVFRLEHKVIPSNVNDQLISLARCRMQSGCSLTDGQLESLLKAPLRNPQVLGREKALVYNALTYYFFNVLHDYPAAINATYQSIRLDPVELENRKTLITILISSKSFDEARRQVELLKHLDTQGNHVSEIETLEQQLPQGR